MSSKDIVKSLSISDWACEIIGNFFKIMIWTTAALRTFSRSSSDTRKLLFLDWPEHKFEGMNNCGLTTIEAAMEDVTKVAKVIQVLNI